MTATLADVAAVADGDDEDEEDLVVDLVDDAVVRVVPDAGEVDDVRCGTTPSTGRVLQARARTCQQGYPLNTFIASLSAAQAKPLQEAAVRPAPDDEQ